MESTKNKQRPQRKLLLPLFGIFAGLALMTSCSGTPLKYRGGYVNPLNWVDGAPDPEPSAPDGALGTFGYLTSLLETWGWLTLILAFAFKQVREPVTHLWVTFFRLISTPLDMAYEWVQQKRGKK